MLKIDRLRIEIDTEVGLYGVDEKFFSGLNFLASDDNTCGKSSVLEGIYYCLGLEEIIGGQGEKVLTSVFKSNIEVEGKAYSVLQSGIYLQISNGEEAITIFRSAKMQNRENKLVTVFFSELDNITDEETLVEDMYVLMPNAATNLKGFHHFLEEFLHLELPLVLATDGHQRKLYLQLILSGMFIEQKHGWGDIFSGMPILGIKNAKKRVVEYIIGLDTYINERKRENLRYEEERIKNKWKNTILKIKTEAARENAIMIGFPMNPCILKENSIDNMSIQIDDQNIEMYIERLKNEYGKIETVTPKVVDNFDELQIELIEIEDDISNFEQQVVDLRQKLFEEKKSIEVFDNNIEVIKNDLRNNKDAARLRDLGSKLDCKSYENICPVCGQKLMDSLLPIEKDIDIMSIDENIRHLQAQKDMLEYARESHNQNRKALDEEIQHLMGRIVSLRGLAKVIRSDLYSVDDSASETIVYKKISLEKEIESIEKLENILNESKNQLCELSKDWKLYLENKKGVPKQKFSESDENKLKMLHETFVSNLIEYGYKSFGNIRDIDISRETYMPTKEEFDMKFDSSASDNIRGIWAYTVGLLQTSMVKKGNHLRVLIFDEPNQQSIVPKDMESFLNSIIKLGNDAQIIVGITVKDTDTKATIEKINKDKYHLIMLSNKAFQKL